jgi:hypothetical protein
MSDRIAWCALAACLAASGPGALAQGTSLTMPRSLPEAPAVVVISEPAPAAEDEARRSLREMQRELRLIRAKYFGTKRNTEIRQVGISKLRQFTDPAVFPSLLEIYEREREDVRVAILDHLADLRTDPADATLAWAAVFDYDKGHRRAAGERLAARVAEAGDASYRVRAVIAHGLRKGSPVVAGSAAQVVTLLRLYDAIPWLISAQVDTFNTADEGQGALAQIIIAQQQTFVSDLQPVVGDHAVAFDPELSVLTDGVVLRVLDAVVVTYRYEVHNALVELTSSAWGKSTAPLGWDQIAWRRWYRDEFLPHMEQVRAREAAQARAEPAPGAPAPEGGGDPSGGG